MSSALRIVFEGLSSQYAKAMQADEERIARAATAAVDDTKTQVLAVGRANIRSGGFGPKWQNALRGTRFPKSGTSIDAAAYFFHRIPYAGVFETGARISGSPLLWIALPHTPATIGGRRMTPRNFVAQVGPLHTIKATGKPPMLAAYMRGKPGTKITLPKLRAGSALARLGVRARKSDLGKAGLVSVPVFVGVTAVRLKKHFDLTTVFEQGAAVLAQKYLQRVG